MKKLLSILSVVGIMTFGVGNVFAANGDGPNTERKGLEYNITVGYTYENFEKMWNRGKSVAKKVKVHTPQGYMDYDNPAPWRARDLKNTADMKKEGTPMAKLNRGFEPQGYMDYDRPSMWRIDRATGTAF